jgi:hypothetical protein
LARSTSWCTDWLLAACLGAVPPAAAQPTDTPPTAPTRAIESVPLARMASGTAWLPDAARPHGFHATLGPWSVMAHGAVFLQYIRESGIRGDGQLGSRNWIMVAAGRRIGEGAVRLRTMVSAEPLTVTPRGYPQLLQVSQVYQGETVSDRQHPHELVIELAASYDHAASPDVGLSAYFGVVGEPALGPVAYPHRPSAVNDPSAPLGHHSQDFTHTTFGVVTVAAFTRALRLEVSAFNGAHPDDVRTDLEAVRLDSYAARVTINPSPHVSGAVWFGRVAATSGTHGHAAFDRFGVSVVHVHRRATGAEWSTALIYGATLPAGARRPLNTLLLESSVELDAANAVFARAEYVRRTAVELSLVGSVSRELDIGAVSLGYTRTAIRRRGVTVALGGRGHTYVVPAELVPFYGSRAPLGALAFVRLRPATAPAHHTP